MPQEVIERMLFGLLIFGAIAYLIKEKSKLSKLIFLITFGIAVSIFFEAGKIMGEGYPSSNLISERTYVVLSANHDPVTNKNCAVLADDSNSNNPGPGIYYDLGTSPIRSLGIEDAVIPYREADGTYTFRNITHPAFQ